MHMIHIKSIGTVKLNMSLLSFCSCSIRMILSSNIYSEVIVLSVEGSWKTKQHLAASNKFQGCHLYIWDISSSSIKENRLWKPTFFIPSFSRFLLFLASVFFAIAIRNDTDFLQRKETMDVFLYIRLVNMRSVKYTFKRYDETSLLRIIDIYNLWNNSWTL